MPTPFGIRRRIKRLLGWNTETPTTEAAPRVQLSVVSPKGEEQSCSSAAGSTILGASGNLKRPIASGCADSTCGTCRVEVLEGSENLSEQNGRERATLKQNGHPNGYRLACVATVEKVAVKVRAFELM
jgi:ferredoxin